MALSIIISILILQMITSLSNESQELGCFRNEECKQIESSFSIVHISFGIIGFIFALGFYLIFFSKGEKEILKRLNSDDLKRSNDEKFELILKGLDSFEKKVFQAVKEQDGITQNTLKIRTNMSKAKLSYVLKDLEKKGLIRRVKQKKTLSVHLMGDF